MSAVRLPPPLVALSPGADAGLERAAFLRAAAAALEAGAGAILLREPAMADRELLELARALRRLLDLRAGWLGIHDRAHLASACGADAVHLGFRSLAPRELRPWLPPSIAVGLSTHAGDDPGARRGADYHFHGPVFPVAKPHARPAIGFDGLARAAEASVLPLWAIGGLRPEHAAPARAAGAAGIAVLSGVFGASDPAAAVRAYLAAWNGAAGGKGPGDIP